MNISFRLTTLLLALALSTTLPAQDMDKELSSLATKLADQIKQNGKKKVTVLDFTDLQGAGSDLGKYIAEELTVDLVMIKKEFSVLDRANLKSILQEHKLTATGLIDPENAKKLGQFAGVDTLVIGTIVPRNDRIQLTAKLITTDTAEIIGAAKSSFTTNDSIQHLLTQPAKTEDAADAGGTAPKPVPPKPFGDLQVKVESMKLLPGDKVYGFARLTLTITNTSATTTYGVGVNPDFYNHFNLSNSRGDEFKAIEVSGIETAFERGGGEFNGALTDIPPRTTITIVSKSQVRWAGKPGDYRPYRLQTEIVFGIEEQGRHPDLKKHNLVLDIK